MRRKDRALDISEAQKILNDGEYGVIASCGADGVPYAIPRSYAVFNGKIYMHSTLGESHFRDNINQNANVCFTVVGKTEVLPSKFSTRYESVVVFGRAREVFDADLKEQALLALVEKYSPDFLESGLDYIQSAIGKTAIVEIEPLNITGKARR